MLCLAVSPARATTELWFKTFFGHYAAAERYERYGLATPGLTDLYAAQISNFIKIDAVRSGIIGPTPGTQGAYASQWTFFGARFLPLPGGAGASYYSVSYLGSNVAFHSGRGADALVGPALISTALSGPPAFAPEQGVSDAFVAANGYGILSRSAHYAPLSFNSADIDGDDKGDFSFGGLIYLSSQNFAAPAWSSAQTGAEVAFIRTANGIRAVRLKAGRLSVAKYIAGYGFTEDAMLTIDQVQVNAGHALTVMPANGNDYVVVRRTCGLQLYSFTGTALTAKACISGLTGNWAMPGARGDFDADGVEDVWISQTDQGNASSPSTSSVSLLSGALLNAATGSPSLASLTIARMNGSSQLSNYDGICTTISPIAGDFDNDGKPDLTCSGHRHMQEAGAMYILRGSDITSGLVLSIADPRVIKIAGAPVSQVAPPYHHWDADDVDGDGYDDIVVTADNDLLSGINSGAIYVLSGKLIKEAAQP